MAPGFFIIRRAFDNDCEAPQMKRALENFAGPYGFRDFEFVRAGPEGAYWKRADGLVVRIAAAEGDSQRKPNAEPRSASLAEWEVALGRSGAT
jgi:hypothetical protein